MKKYRVWAVILPFCLTTVLVGCVPTEKSPVVAENAAAARTGKKQRPAKVKAKPPHPPADPCATIVDQLAAQAREGMKTFTGICQNQRVEVNPMWAPHYNGAVRVRIYNAAGKLKRLETLNSKDLPTTL